MSDWLDYEREIAWQQFRYNAYKYNSISSYFTPTYSGYSKSTPEEPEEIKQVKTNKKLLLLK